MSFLDDSEKNVKKHLLKEVTAGTVGGFTGTAGTRVDQLFAGGFHPEFGEIEKILNKQLKSRKQQDNNGAENPVGGWYHMNDEELDPAYEELDRFGAIHKEINDINTPEENLEWVEVEKDYNYDGPGTAYSLKVIVYDKDKPRYNKKDFLNSSETIWKTIRRR